jgi:hypothetical protein
MGIGVRRYAPADFIQGEPVPIVQGVGGAAGPCLDG